MRFSTYICKDIPKKLYRFCVKNCTKNYTVLYCNCIRHKMKVFINILQNKKKEKKQNNNV